MPAIHPPESDAFFPYGVAYYQPPVPLPKYWETDLKLIREAGLNAIRTNLYWSLAEPEEGKLDLSTFDRLFDLADKNGLKVIATLYQVCAPEWLFEKHPDSRYVSASGYAVDSGQHPDAAGGGYPGLCLDSQKVRDDMERYLRSLVEHYKGHPAIYAFDFIHEPTEEPIHAYFLDTWREMLYCYCPHTEEKFRGWLANKYGSLEGLNAAWHRRYSRWQQVHPPKTFGVYTDWLDWKHFSVEALADEIRWGRRIIKETDPDRRVVAHHAIWRIAYPFTTSSDIFTLSQCVDTYGASCYDVDEPNEAASACDALRSASRNGDFWGAETTGGSGPMFAWIGSDPSAMTPYAKPVTKEKINKHIWETIAHGAKGIMYWTWRPGLYANEVDAMGLTDREGLPTDRVEAASKIARVISENHDLFRYARVPKSEVAILYGLDSFLQAGMISTFKTHATDLRDFDSLINAHKLFWQESVPVDFVNKEQALAGKLAEYKLLVLPYTIVVTSDLGEKIKEFVHNGGIVLAEALCGYFTDAGWGAERCPGAGLDEVFGCKVVWRDLVKQCEVQIDPQVSGLGAVGPLGGYDILETLEILPGGQAIARSEHGKPVAALGRYGSGQAVYIGSLLMLKGENVASASARALTAALLQMARVSRPVLVTAEAGGIEARVLTHGSERLLFVLNHSETEASATVTVAAEGRLSSVVSLLDGKHIASRQAGADLELHVRLEPLEVSVMKLS